MPYNHRLENQDLRPTTRQDDRAEELSQQDLNAVSGGEGPELYVDDMTIGGKNWVEQHGPVTPADHGGVYNIDSSAPIQTDPSPPPAPNTP